MIPEQHPPLEAETDQASPAHPSIGEMVGDIAHDFSVMLRAEARLAQLEIKRNLSHITPALITLGMVAILAIAAAVVLLSGVAILLHPILGAGWAEILLALVVLLGAAWAARQAVRRIAESKLAPERAGHAIKKSPDALKGQI